MYIIIAKLLHISKLLFAYITNVYNYHSSLMGTIILRIKGDHLCKALGIVPAKT